MRCNFTDPSTGATHQEIIDDLQEEIADQAKQIVELARARRDLLEACTAFVNSFYSEDQKHVKSRLSAALQLAKAAIAKAEGQS